MAKATRIPALGPRTRLAVAGPLLLEARLADVRRHEAALFDPSASGAAADRAEPDPDAVHDMRVAARRLRAALRLFGDGRAWALEPQVKALQDALGAVRDVQVHRDWVAARAGGDPAVLELARRVDAERPAAEKKLRAALRAWSSAVAPALADASLAAGGRGSLGGNRIRKEVRRARARLERRMEEAAREELAPPAAHAMRIAAKKLRYLAELAAPGRPKKTRRLLAALEPFLDHLGALHDADVRMARLERLDAGGEDGAAPGVREASRALLEGVAAERARMADALLDELELLRREGLARAGARAGGDGPQPAAVPALTSPARPPASLRAPSPS
ncbi:MAG TPA: CHAD domain-containing protein [Anaeromyxobacter sp.]|nr:CHAD domain-containing protein [Anaeromyxobacter sp.]